MDKSGSALLTWHYSQNTHNNTGSIFYITGLSSFESPEAVDMFFVVVLLHLLEQKPSLTLAGQKVVELRKRTSKPLQKEVLKQIPAVLVVRILKKNSFEMCSRHPSQEDLTSCLLISSTNSSFRPFSSLQAFSSSSEPASFV